MSDKKQRFLIDASNQSYLKSDKNKKIANEMRSMCIKFSLKGICHFIKKPAQCVLAGFRFLIEKAINVLSPLFCS
jgi:hypothetical protein